MTSTDDSITYVDVKPAPGALIWPRELDEGSHVHHRMTGECLKRLDGPKCDEPPTQAPDRASRYYAAMTSSTTRRLDAVLRLVDEETADTIDVAHLERQRAWSAETFGPGPRTAGVLDHITKELDEIRADPSDLGEWVDVVILAFDGALRAGHDPLWIIRGIKAKQARNEARTWPDWRTADPDRAIEHVR